MPVGDSESSSSLPQSGPGEEDQQPEDLIGEGGTQVVWEDRWHEEEIFANRLSFYILASSGDADAPCAVPSSVLDHSPSSMMPALSHFWISRRTRLSAIRCSRNFTSYDWSRPVKKSLMSASSTKLTFLCVIPTASASNASCCERPGRKSCSYTAFKTSTTAR
jgi:hypothetical protein